VDTKQVGPSPEDYASHVAVLTALLDAYPVSRIVEHGCGEYSTPLLAAHCVGFSVDNNPEWIERVRALVPKAWLILEEDRLDRVHVKGADLVFVDGYTDTRRVSAQIALHEDVPFVVLHDAERPGTYKWNRLYKPPAYWQYDFQAQFGRGKVTRIYSLMPIEISPARHAKT